MSYIDQPQASNRRLIALALAALVHLLLGYAFITGLATKVFKKIVDPIEAVPIEEELPEEPPPPPPEQLEEIPVVTPPPIVSIDRPPPPTTITTESTIVRPTAPPPVMAPPAPVEAPPPPPPPAPKAEPTKAKLRGNRLKLITNDDYPEASIRAEEEGRTFVRYDISAEGRVENCTVTQSSGSRRLDEATCTLITRRFRFEPARNPDGQPVRQDGQTDSVTWRLPQE
jgi:protein TonB